jgi:hypothetical protein
MKSANITTPNPRTSKTTNGVRIDGVGVSGRLLSWQLKQMPSTACLIERDLLHLPQMKTPSSSFLLTFIGVVRKESSQS